MRPSGQGSSPKPNFFRWVADLGIRRPWWVLGVVGIITVFAGILTHGMPVSTSRYKLVSEADNPLQARRAAFWDRFGYQDALVMVLTGGEAAERQRVATELCAKLETSERFAGRTMCRIGAEQMAEVAFLFKPEALGELRKRFGDADLGAVVEGGLPVWVGAVEQQITRALQGETGGSAPSAEEIEAGPAALASALRALDAQLRGGDPLTALPSLAAAEKIPGGIHLDDRGFLVGADGTYHVVALFPELPGTEGLELKPFVDEIRAARDAIDLGGVSANLTGMPAVVVDELQVVTRGLQQSTAATIVGILLLLYIGYRSFRYSLIALVPLAVGTVVSLAFTRLVFGGTNLITSSFVSVLMGIGSDFAIIMLGRYSEQLRAGQSSAAAIRSALVLCGPGTLIAATTTIAAFLTLTTTTFTAYAQLGIIVGAGLAFMVLFTVLLLPPVVTLVNTKRKRMAAPEFIGMRHLPPIVRKGRHAIVFVGGILAVWAAIQAFGLKFNARYFDFLPEGAESVRGLERIERDESVTPMVANVPTDGVEQARSIAAALRTLPSVGSVDTATDTLPELTDERLENLRDGLKALGKMPDFGKLRARTRSAKEVVSKLGLLVDAFDEAAFGARQAGKPTAGLEDAKKACAEVQMTLRDLPDDGRVALGALETQVANLLERAWSTATAVAARGAYAPSDLPPVFRARFVAKDGQGMAVYVQPGGNIWKSDAAQRFYNEVVEVAPEASGLALEVHSHQSDILRSFTRAALITAGLMFLTCLVSLRSLRDAVLAMLPVLVGFSLMMGFMATAKIDINVANIVALPQLQGISVELGAQILVRTRQSAAEQGGVAKLRDVLQGTGSSILIAAGTTILGFAALTLADYRAMKSFGLMMTVGTTSTIVASLVFLPAVLVLLKRAK